MRLGSSGLLIFLRRRYFYIEQASQSIFIRILLLEGWLQIIEGVFFLVSASSLHTNLQLQFQP